MKLKTIEMDGQVYIEFGYSEDDELLLLEIDLVTEEDDSDDGVI